MCLSLYVNLWTGTWCLFYGWQQFKGIQLDIVDKGRRGSGEKNELMMLANISPCISILFRKWLSGFEAVWSSIVSDSQSRCDCTLNRASLLLTNTVHWGRDEDALLSVLGGVWLFFWHSWWHLRKIVLGLVEFPAQVREHIGSQGSWKCLLMSMYAAYWITYLPVIYASFGNQIHLPKLTVKSNSDFDISLNFTWATKNQWARIRAKHKKFQCLLRHLLDFFIISSQISYMAPACALALECNLTRFLPMLSQIPLYSHSF